MYIQEQKPTVHSTTILSIRRNNQVTMGGDGQVSVGATIMKNNATKDRQLKNHPVLVGFAGATADAFTLFDRFETKLDTYQGNLLRASIELAKDWRTDKVLRRLEALLAVADLKTSLIISGTGDVIEPEDNIMAIGSGGDYARSAATALLKHTQLDAESIVKEGLNIAANTCIYTNNVFNIVTLKTNEKE